LPAGAHLHYAPLRVTITPRSDRGQLSREYRDFLVELSVALHKYGMYPSGHPSLDPAAGAVAARAAHLLVDRPHVAFGIARRQLIVDGVATSADQPALRRLAEELHRHHLGAFSVHRGVEVTEFAEALRALSLEPERAGPIGVGKAGRLAWPHLQLHALIFDDLALAGDAPNVGVEGAAAGLRAGELWLSLARAALGGRADAATDASEFDSDLLARAVDEHPRSEANDQAVTAALLQIAQELRTDRGADAARLRQRAERFLSRVSPETLRRLLEMGGDGAQRRRFVLDASHGMAAGAVIDIVKAAAEASGQTISHGLLRMMSKLAVHAEFGAPQARRQAAQDGLREQIDQLLAGWHLADPNPGAYTAVLQEFATLAPQPGRHPSDDSAAVPSEPLDPVRVIQMSLELGDAGPVVQRAVLNALGEGRAGDVLAVLSRGPDGSHDVADTIRTYFIQPEALRAFFEQGPVDFDTLDLLRPSMTATSYEVLLDLLITTSDRTTRRKLFDRIVQAPFDLGPAIAARLDDPRWFVQRNMLGLLERLGRVPEGLSLARWTSHPDVRVRHEAIRLQLVLPAERQAAVRAAIEDGHPRLVHSGLAAIQQNCPPGLAGAVGALARDTAITEELRLLAIRALGRCPDPRALATLLELTRGGRTIFGRAKLAARSPTMLAAVRALAGGWRSDVRAAEMLMLAEGASDIEIRRAAGTERR
jgi:hypothetical protein